MWVTLEYIKTATTYRQLFNVHSARGLYDVDDIEINGVIHNYLNGNIDEQNNGFRKIIEIDFPPTTSERERRFLAQWFCSQNKRIYYYQSATFYLNVVAADDSLVSEWLDDIEYGRRFTARFKSALVYHDFSITDALAEELMYFKAQVLITGTLASPQTFTTGTAPLDVMENLEPWPTFDDATDTFHVELSKYQERGMSIVKDSVAEVGGNLTFQAALDDVGKDNDSSGNNYADVTIYLQAIP